VFTFPEVAGMKSVWIKPKHAVEHNV